MESIGDAERDRPERSADITDDEGREMPPEPEPSPGEIDREKLGEDDVSEQAP